MKDFVDFCRSYGITLDHLPPVGRWVRVKTEDKPRHRNGSVKWMGDIGFCQNWATMDEPAMWRGEATRDVIQRIKRDSLAAEREANRMATRAAQKAAVMLVESSPDVHPYFERKGFPDHITNVCKDGSAMIPMYRDRVIVGCQTITPDGDKKFLYGQRSGGAEFVMGQRGKHFLCEGYATALSAQAVLRNLKTPYILHVCFSAGNMKKIAQGLPGGVVLAEHDASGTGERIAREIGWPYWMSDTQGEDFNDAHLRIGTFPLAMQLRKVLTSRRAA